MIFLALAALLGSPSFNAVAKPPESAQDLYERGVRQMRSGNHTKALETLSRVRNFHRDDPVSVLAELAIADLHFRKKDWAQARFAYEEFADLHPRHASLDYVVWRIGLSIHKDSRRWAGRDQTNTRAAVDAWTGFEARFPDSAYRERVATLSNRDRDRLAYKELIIARFYARDDAWRAVRSRTEGLVRTYPHSRHVPKALRFLATSLHAWGDVANADLVRQELASWDDHRELRRLDRRLERPAGQPPEEKTFVRPYRLSTLPRRAPSGANPGPGR